MTNLAAHRPAQLQVSGRDTVIGTHRVMIVLGWVLATAVVAGITQLFRRR